MAKFVKGDAILDKQEKLRQLKDYFLKESSIVMAFIFGSYLEKRFNPESDIDIAVYFKSEGLELEWESDGYYQGEDRIWGELEKIMQRKVDLVVLNRAPVMLAFDILSRGKPVIIKDRRVYLLFLLRASSEAEYFRGFIKDFWDIEQRSSSLIETDKIRLIALIKFLDNELKDYSEYADLDWKIYQENSLIRRSVERWVENIVNGSIDIAKVLLASDKKRLPATYRETLEFLGLLPDFEEELAKELANFAKLRNLLAHEYLDIRFRHIRQFIDKALPLYEKLIGFVSGRYIKDD